MDHRKGGCRARLETLGVHVKAHGFEVELTGDGLRVAVPGSRGCCEAATQRADRITCRAREEDDGALWFFTSWGEPLAEADQITAAVVGIKGNLSAGAGR